MLTRLMPLLVLLAACEELPKDTTATGETGDTGPSTTDTDTTLPGCEAPEVLTNEMFAGGLVLPAGSCWSVTERLYLSDGTVTVEEGVRIDVATGIGVEVNAGGQLKMLGTEQAPVQWTTSDPLIRWKGIRFADSQGSDNVWSWVVVENAGSDPWSGDPDYTGAVVIDQATTLSTDHVTIRGSDSAGLWVSGNASFSFIDGALEDNGLPAWVHPNQVGALGAETVFSGNEDSFVRVVHTSSDRVDQDTTWVALDVPWRASERFYVDANLVIEPGTVIEMDADLALYLQGQASLTALGTEDAPIVMRGASAGTRGFWKGISVEVGGTDEPLQYGVVLDHVSIEDGGSSPWNGDPHSQAALWMAVTSSASITNSRIANSGLYGLYANGNARIDGFAYNRFEDNATPMFLHPDRVGELSGTATFSGNDDERIWVSQSSSDRVTVAQTWPAQEVPYRLSNRTYVEAPLVVEAGTVVEVAQDVSLRVHDVGSLTTEGSAKAPVVFMGEQSPAAGFWMGIEIDTNQPANVLTWTEVWDAGVDPWNGNPDTQASIMLQSDSYLSLQDVVIGGGGYAIYWSADSVLSCSGVDVSGTLGVYDGLANGVLTGC